MKKSASRKYDWLHLCKTKNCIHKIIISFSTTFLPVAQHGESSNHQVDLICVDLQRFN